MKPLFPVIFILLSAQGFSELKLPHIFGSQMVLQRDKPARIWGWADTEKEIVITFAGQKKVHRLRRDGKWEISLDPMPANATGQTLKIVSEDHSIILEDVLLGDVWICGGQSNMEWRLRSSRDADIEIPSARYPAIRFIRIEPEGLPEPQDDFPSEKGAGNLEPMLSRNDR
jgi:sialate O-acetylesterase